MFKINVQLSLDLYTNFDSCHVELRSVYIFQYSILRRMLIGAKGLCTFFHNIYLAQEPLSGHSM